MEIVIEYQEKSSCLERPDNHYGNNLPDLQDMLTTALYGVGLQLNGEIVPLEEKQG